MAGATDPIAATAVASATGAGRLTTVGRLHRPLSGRQKILKGLHRVFDRTHQGALALRINAPNGLAGGLRWKIAETPALEQRVLLVQCAGQPDVVIPLEGRTIRQVRDAVEPAGLVLAFATEAEAVLVLDALALVPGEGEEWVSNGDHIYARQSLLWSWADPVGRWLDQSRVDIAEMLRMLIVRQSGGYWSELWASYFGLRRRGGELDASLNQRTEWEWRRRRGNPKAMELNIIRRTGQPVTVREPWRQMMVASGSIIGGADKLPNEEEFAYHRMQLTSREEVDWDAASEEAEADRPAGTLMLAPVTEHWPWLIVPPAPPRIEFAAAPVFSERVQDYDGQIISVTWDLSNTFVLLNPAIAIGTDFTITTDPLGSPGDIANRLTFSKGAMIVSEQWALGDQQMHLSGRMQIEVGTGMVASGDTPLSDYENRLEWVPVDEWLLDQRSFDPGAALVLPAQIAMESEQGTGALVVAQDQVLDTSSEEIYPIEAGAAYGSGWRGRWDRRKWVGSYPDPVVAFAGTSYSLQAAGFGSASGSAELSTATRMFGAGAARATLGGVLTTGLRFASAGTATASATAFLRIAARLAAMATATGNAIGSLATGLRLAGSGAGTASAAASLATAIRLAGTSSASASSSGGIDETLRAVLEATPMVAGSLSTVIRLAAAPAATASSAAALAAAIRLAGAGQGAAASTAGLTVGTLLAGAGAGTASAGGSLKTGVGFAAGATATAAATASLTTLAVGEWAPSLLGSSLVYATDTNSTATVPDDGAGKAQFARHLYDPNKALVQSLPGQRPSIITGSGVTGNKRALAFGSTGMLLAGGPDGSLPALVALFNDATSMVGTSGTFIVAAQIDLAASFTFLGAWSNAAGSDYVQLRQDGTSLGFQAQSTDTTSAAGPRASGWCVLTGVKDGGTVTLRKDGTVIATATSASGRPFTASDFAVGGYNDVDEFVSGFGPQALTAIVIANRALTTVELGQAEKWAGATAGIEGSTSYDTTDLTLYLSPATTNKRTITNGSFTALSATIGKASDTLSPFSVAGPPLGTLAGRDVMNFGNVGGTRLKANGDPNSNSAGLHEYFGSFGPTRTFTFVIRTPDAWPTDRTTMGMGGTWWNGTASNRRWFGLRNFAGSWRPMIGGSDSANNLQEKYPDSGALMPGTLYHLTFSFNNGVPKIYINGAQQTLNSTAAGEGGHVAHPNRNNSFGSVVLVDAAGNGTVANFAGMICEILVHKDVQLSDARIAADVTVTTRRYPGV